MQASIFDLFVPKGPRRYTKIGPGVRDICPELGRHYPVSSSRNAPKRKCKRPGLGTSKAELLELHRRKMEWKKTRHA